MNTYKYYKKEGNSFVLIHRPAFKILFVLFIVTIAAIVYGAINKNNTNTALIVGALGILFVVIILTKKFVINTNAQTITAKHLFTGTKTYYFKDFVNFNVTHTKYYGFITVNSILSASFDVNGKTKELTVGQALTKKAIQRMLNETEDLMNISTANV